MKGLFEDCSLSALVAGGVATLISFAGPLVIIFQAADAGGLDSRQLSSWIAAISLGSAVLGFWLSLRYRVPVVIAWSIPGSALLVSALPQIGLEQAVGAYLIANLMLVLIGVSGAFDWLVARLPGSIAAGLQAGILFGFGVGVFQSLPAQPVLVLAMFAAYVLLRRLLPRYAVAVVLLVGVSVALLGGSLKVPHLAFEWASLQWIEPRFSFSAVLNLALPLVLVALTGQFMPGMAVLRNAGYPIASGPLISASAWVGALLAPFGCHGLNLAAVTASLCTSREAHENPARRYIAALSGSLFYLLFGLAGATVVALFAALPGELIAALAGLALFGALSEALSRSCAVEGERDAGLFTFLVTASGVSFLGLSAAFWGLVLGLLVHLLQQARRKRLEIRGPVSR
ncbi:benzoate/H(+) symporter BenE family transporter [Pseudomonas sp. LRF_L74]|uniref:benzoate/H(+) symporter BenE family transporter n=1 Tax=Pseudomonas sp. LRF_L74 TaxID=3369422 RepID=UPI003F611116